VFPQSTIKAAPEDHTRRRAFTTLLTDAPAWPLAEGAQQRRLGSALRKIAWFCNDDSCLVELPADARLCRPSRRRRARNSAVWREEVRAHLGARRGANARYFRSAGLLLQQAARVELIINLQTAEAFGLIIIPRRK
jgi:hypothetical protein